MAPKVEMRREWDFKPYVEKHEWFPELIKDISLLINHQFRMLYLRSLSKIKEKIENDPQLRFQHLEAKRGDSGLKTILHCTARACLQKQKQRAKN